jgi:hypothetical protein
MGASIGAGDLDGTSIEGGTDGTKIGNVTDSLKVNISSVSVDPDTAYDWMAYRAYLKRSGSKNLVVNASLGSPQDFDYSPATATEYVTAVALFLLDTGAGTADKFGVLTALTNGCQVSIRSKGTAYDLHDDPIKNNEDLLHFGTGRSSMTAPTAGGLFSSDDWLMAVFEFSKPIKIQQSTSDYVRIRIRDNLTGIDFFKAFVHTRRII